MKSCVLFERGFRLRHVVLYQVAQSPQEAFPCGRGQQTLEVKAFLRTQCGHIDQIWFSPSQVRERPVRKDLFYFIFITLITNAPVSVNMPVPSE